MVSFKFQIVLAGLISLGSFFYVGKSFANEKDGSKADIMVLASAAFSQGAPIPKKYTSDGANVSPPLSWTAFPSSTKVFALICDDPDAPGGLWVHWVLYDLPGNTMQLAEGIAPTAVLASGAKQGTNSFHKLGYGGPSPPSGTHRYLFKLFALDKPLGLPPGRTASEVQKAMVGHILSESQLMGRYSR